MYPCVSAEVRRAASRESHRMEKYWHRIIDDQIDQLFSGLPAISIEGPRGIGKTTTARQRAGTFVALDDGAVRQIMASDPQQIAEAPPPVVVDEWQMVPESWDVVRRAVDDDYAPGRFLLTGSASPTTHPTHSGAGRIVALKMRPLALAERGDTPIFTQPTVSLQELLTGNRPTIGGSTEARLADYVSEITRSGLPAVRRLKGRVRDAALDGYIARIVERDIPNSGRSTRNPAALMRWLRAYAAATATSAAYERIRDAATSGEGDKPSRSATAPFVDILERLYVLEPLPGWVPTRNQLTKLTTGPKHHLADPAWATTLLGLDEDALLEGRQSDMPVPRDGTLLGCLFESLLTLNLRVYAQSSNAAVFHLRTHQGLREVDFVVARRDGRVVALEAKLARSVTDHDLRHLRWLQQQIGPDLLDAAVITTGPYAYRRPDDHIAVIPAALLGP